MNLKPPAMVATATFAAAGFGSVAYACDERSLICQQQVPIVERPNGRADPSASDSPHDADVRRGVGANRQAGV
jgi:hypothetical protein